MDYLLCLPKLLEVILRAACVVRFSRLLLSYIYPPKIWPTRRRLDAVVYMVSCVLLDRETKGNWSLYLVQIIQSDVLEGKLIVFHVS